MFFMLIFALLCISVFLQAFTLRTLQRRLIALERWRDLKDDVTQITATGTGAAAAVCVTKENGNP